MNFQIKGHRLKKLLFGGLVLVIICSVALPALLSSCGEKSLLNNVETFDNTLTSPNVSPSTKTRLSLISSHALGTSAVTLTEQKNIIASGGENAVLSAAVAEVKKLANLGLVPSLDPDSSAEGLTCSAATYTSAEDISSRVTLWKLGFSADGYDISIWMDAETHKVFCVSFKNTAFELSSENAQGICDAWGSYLGLTGSLETAGETGFSAVFEETEFEFLTDSEGISVCIAGSGF